MLWLYVAVNLNVAGPSGVRLHGANKPGKLQKEPQTIMQTSQRGDELRTLQQPEPSLNVALELVSNVAGAWFQYNNTLTWQACLRAACQHSQASCARYKNPHKASLL
jgi:hypothetical protein